MKIKRIIASSLSVLIIVGLSTSCLLINNAKGRESPAPIPFLLKDIMVSDSGQKISSVEEWNLQRKKIKSLILSFLGEFPKQKEPLNTQILEEEHQDGYILRKVTYKTEKDDLVIAYLLIPEINLHPGIAILALHPTTDSGKDSVVGIGDEAKYPYALELAKRGYIVLAPDEFCAGERVKEGDEPYYTTSFYAKHPNWSAIGKAIWDNMVSIDFLTSISHLGIKKVVSIGHSQGGADSIFLAAFDERVIATISNCGFSTIAGDPRPTRWARTFWFIAIPALRPHLQKGITPFDFHQVTVLIAPRAFLNISATKDEVWPFVKGVKAIEKHLKKVYKLYNSENQFEFFYFNGAHSFPKKMRISSYRWLKKILESTSQQ